MERLDFDVFSQTDTLIDLEKQMNEKLKNEFKEKLEQIDLKIMNSSWRINEGWIVWDKNCKRTIITKFGEIRIKRTKYKNKFTGKCSFLADPYMEIEKYKRISFCFEKEIIASFGNGESQVIVWKKFFNSGITKRTISNIVKKNSQIKTREICSIEGPKFINDLPIYVDIDDCWTSAKIKNKKIELRIRVAVSHQGKMNNKSRNFLINKKAFIQTYKKGTAINTKNYVFWLTKMLERQYGNLSNKKIIICGDGASWIKEIASFMGASYVLDKFHLFQKIYLCFAYKKSTSEKYLKNKRLYDKAIELYKENNLEGLIWFLTENIDSNNKSKYCKSVIRYIKNNLIGIKNHFENWNVGCSAESAVAHLIKSIKGFGSKIYDKNSLDFLIDINIARINGFNLADYLDKYRKEEFNDQIYDIFYYQINKMNNHEKRLGKLPDFSIPVLKTTSSKIGEAIRKLTNKNK